MLTVDTTLDHAAPIRRFQSTLVAFSIILLALAGLAWTYDASIVSIVTADNLPGDIRKAVNLSEAFAHGISVAVILATILISTSGISRKMVWLAVWTTLVSGVTANLLKSGFVRIRPHSVDVIAIEETQVATTPDSRPGPEVVEASFWDARQRSFPSGHAATACGLAIGLSLAFPRAAALFMFLAGMACLQRIASGAHFLSDVLAGAAIACICSAGVLTHSKLRQIFVDSHIQLGDEQSHQFASQSKPANRAA